MDKAERDRFRKGIELITDPRNTPTIGIPDDAIVMHKSDVFALLDHIDALEQKREGWKWVPVEPTPAMIDASYRGMIDTCSTDVYKAMIAAAPEPQS